MMMEKVDRLGYVKTIHHQMRARRISAPEGLTAHRQFRTGFSDLKRQRAPEDFLFEVSFIFSIGFDIR